MNEQEFIDMVDNRTVEAYPTNQRLTEKDKKAIYKLYLQGKDWEGDLTRRIDWTAKKCIFPNYWYHRGIYDVNLCDEYASTYKERLLTIENCKMCGKVFVKENARKDPTKFNKRHTCCSKECDDLNLLNWGSRLSESKQLYNPNDPKQYANRHGISVEEAEERVKEFQYSGSVRRTEYWVRIGFTEEEAKAKVIEVQSKCSPRSKLFWLDRGYTEEEAVVEVSEAQRDNAFAIHAKVRENGSRMYSHYDYQYHMNKQGISEEDARLIVSENSRKAGKKWNDYLLSLPEEERKAQSPKYIEYWIDKGYGVEEFQEYMASIKMPQCFRSKMADRFCDMLASYFSESKIYMKETEYGKYIPDLERYCRYDYTDSTNEVIVEFNGNYWHSSEESATLDAAKKEYAESVMGYKFYTVWESEFIGREHECVYEIANRIKQDCQIDQTSGASLGL